MHRQVQNNPQSEDSIQNLKKLSAIRELRAKEVLMVGKPQLLSEEEFLVPSSNGKDSYKVIHLDSWSCNCLDFTNRCKKLNIYCKHIKALQLFLKLRNNQEVKDFDVLQIVNEEGNCIYCKSDKITKQGYRINKNGKKQKFRCNECKKHFVLDPVKYHKANAKIIVLTMDLYYKGLSLRDIQDTVAQFYNISLHHETVRRWILKFSKLMNNYVEKETKDKLKLGSKWQTDEQTVQVGKEKLWNWNTIDTETKYLLANNITRSRYYEDIVKIASKSKEVGGRPEEFRTDGLQGYKRAVQEVYELGKIQEPYTVHVKSKGFKDKINTNNIERYHNEFREFDKTRRGFGNMESAQEWNDGYRLFHNVIRKNMALNGLTPLQMAQIDLKLGNNRWLGLLKEGVKNDR